MDLYAEWRMRLATGRLAGSDTPLHGFWRRKLGKGGRWQAVAVFERDGVVVCIADGIEQPVQLIWSVFMEAVEEDRWRRAAESGRWDDEFEARPGSSRHGTLTTDLRAASAVMPIVRGRNGQHSVDAAQPARGDGREPSSGPE